jgi:phosphoribosylformylglycinamidine synthase
MAPVFRCYVEYDPGFDIEARAILRELRDFVGLTGLREVRLLRRYDIQGVADESVLTPPQGRLYRDMPPVGEDTRVLAVEHLPGQFDQDAGTMALCMQLRLGGERPAVFRADIYLLAGLTDTEYRQAEAYLVNPVERRPVPPARVDALTEPPDIPVLHGFISGSHTPAALAMDAADLECARAYFKGIGRDPTATELRVLDTYWSDHCRHTTFLTRLDIGAIEDGRVRSAYERYLNARREIYGGHADARPVTLMDIATTPMKLFKKQGKLPALDESEEINACSVRVQADVDGEPVNILLMFKNETHNHPTEIEPYGGAGTCLGGAIRDPLSGRAYVYQAMRITGAADPRVSFADTIPGKIPQRALTNTAAAGYSDYGNQAGLASGLLHEFYHPGYAAKRMELGALVGSVPADWVVRKTPEPGDAILLIGGRTGRDGCGGATGSSKVQTVEAATVHAAEVQKGDPFEGRKLIRLYRNPAFTRLIKRCNDFGAGGVSVAVGELADGLDINLDAVPVKYPGLDGTELAISESQERMAVVVAPGNATALSALCAAEGVACTQIAEVAEEPRIKMTWRGKEIVNISREFLNSNGAAKTAKVEVLCRGETGGHGSPSLQALLSDLRFCSRRNLSERFGSTVGAGTILMPYGGKTGRTPIQAMAARIPAGDRLSDTASLMAYGFDPHRTEADSFGGSAAAVVESVAKLVAAGVSPDTVHLSFQEYFKSHRGDPERWGDPFAALLGAFDAQLGLGIASIGGKDSMSGSYQDLDVPPTLASFAVGTAPVREVLSPEFKGTGTPVYLFEAPAGDYAAIRTMWERFHTLCRQGGVLAAYAMEPGGLARAAAMMALGNEIGFAGEPSVDWFADRPGALIAELKNDCGFGTKIGTTTADKTVLGEPIADLGSAWEGTLAGVFPGTPQASRPPDASPAPFSKGAKNEAQIHAVTPLPPQRPLRPASPRALIPVFPGTTGEFDTARAVKRAGGIAETVLIRTLAPAMLEESCRALESALKQTQMLILPGGYAAQIAASLLGTPRIHEAIHRLLANDGLVLGLGEGFGALLRLGLLPGTLTANPIGRHVSRYVDTVVESARSPWMSRCKTGAVYTLPLCTGNGLYTGTPDAAASRFVSGGIESVASPDGRILGKITHPERGAPGAAINIPGEKHMPVFEGGVAYFK